MAHYNASYAGIGEMLRSPAMIAAMAAKAEKVKARCEETAPVYEEGPHPGRYKGAFSVESGVQDHKTSRAVGRVVNDSPEARWVEWGTEHNEAHHTMAAALEAAKE